MGMRKEIEQLRESIASIKQEANEKKIAERQAQIQKEKEESDRREKEKAEQEMADRNWPLVREPIVAFLHEINKEVLGSRGKVLEGIRQIPYHEHKVEHWDRDVSGNGSFFSWNTYYYLEGCSDVVELKVEDMGSVIVFKPLKVTRYGYGDGGEYEAPDRYKHKAPGRRSETREGLPIKREKIDDHKNDVLVKALTKKEYERSDCWFCPKDESPLVLHLSSSPEEVILEIENEISKKVLALYRRALLD